MLQYVHVHIHIPQTFINYLQGVGDPGTRLLFKFRSGTNGLNEELGRHRGNNDDRQCKRYGSNMSILLFLLWFWWLIHILLSLCVTIMIVMQFCYS